MLGDPFFNALLNAAPGDEVTITSTPQTSSINKVTTTNTLHKVGTMTMTNSRELDLGIDPISGEVTIVDGSTGAACTKYTRNTISGVLCDLMEYTFIGEDVTGYSPGLALTSSRVNSVLQSHMSGGTGLAAELTFDESNWYSISGGIQSDTRVLAQTFLAAPQKNGGKAYLKIFLPKALILSVAQAGDGTGIGNIVSLCLTPGNSSLAADFCFQPGGGVVINPIEPGLEIVPDNPDYALDPNGLGGSGTGIIGETPLSLIHI